MVFFEGPLMPSCKLAALYFFPHVNRADLDQSMKVNCNVFPRPSGGAIMVPRRYLPHAKDGLGLSVFVFTFNQDKTKSQEKPIANKVSHLRLIA